MRKIFIEDARIDSFLNDLEKRITDSLDNDASIVELRIIGLGESGTQVVQRFWDNSKLKDSKQGVISQICAAQKDEFGEIFFVIGESKFSSDEYIKTVSHGIAFLVMDGICRTGRTLTEIYEKLSKVSKKVWTYSVAVCADSSIIPTWYGCLYPGNEFVVLSREGKTPNTSLYIGLGGASYSPALTLRPPLDTDPDFDAGEKNASINRYKSEDRYFDSTTHSKKIQVLEWDSTPVGFVAYHISGATLWVDYIVACQKHAKEKKGIGSALYYHVENYAKLSGCKTISLWAIKNKVDWYTNRGFSIEAGKKPISIGKGADAEIYLPMSHRLVSDMGQYHP